MLNRRHSVASTPVSASTAAPNAEQRLLYYALGWFTHNLQARLPIAISRTHSWMVPAPVPAPFPALYRGDALASAVPQLDGVGGDLTMAEEHGAPQIRLHTSAAQLAVVCVAGHAPEPEPSARDGYLGRPALSAACIAELLRRANRPPREMAHLSLTIVVPQDAISQGRSSAAQLHTLMCDQVARRVREHEGRQNYWNTDWFQPVIARLALQYISWESILETIAQHDPAAGREAAGLYHHSAPPLLERARG